MANFVGPTSGGMKVVIDTLGAGYVAAGHERILVVPGPRDRVEETATGIIVSQVMPLPSNKVLQLVREFQQAWKTAGVTLEPSHLALEGYVNAKVFAEALRRAGRNPTQASFIDNLWSMKQYDLGGFEVSFTDSSRSASRFVELNMISRDGRFIR